MSASVGWLGGEDIASDASGVLLLAGKLVPPHPDQVPYPVLITLDADGQACGR